MRRRSSLSLRPRKPRLTQAESVREAQESFAELRQIIRRQRWPEAETTVCRLERKVCGRLAELEEIATAVAEANVRSVEILDQQEHLRSELERQYQQICVQNETIISQQRQVELRAEALAEANVEAVFLLDGTKDKLQEVSKLRDDLHWSNIELVRRTRELESEAMALAEANAVAVEMLDQHQERADAASGAADRLRADNEELFQQAQVDGLTGLLNHRFFSDQIAFEVARAQRYGRELSLLFVDVDHFKQLNDTHGHPVGDVVLKELASLLRDEVRGADLPLRTEGSPFAARYGGEEFVVILPETAEPGAKFCAERLRASVAATAMPGGLTQPGGRLTISVGVATLHRGEDAAELVKRADDALYRAKRSGRNRVVLASERSGSSDTQLRAVTDRLSREQTS